MMAGPMPEPSQPLATVLLPGLEGTGRLFSRFLAAADGSLDFRVVSYPPDRFLGYAALEELVRLHLPVGRPFALVGESFAGPLALRVAAKAPPGLVAVVLVATFHRRPAARLFRAATPLGPAFFRLPMPPHAVRLLLAGHDAPEELVQEVRAAVAAVKGKVMMARARAALHVDATEELRACPVPLLFLGGKEDHLLRSALPIEVRALRPDAEIRMLDSPHLVLQLRPEESMRIVKEFVLRAAARRGAPGPLRTAG